jgi:hypothetical protein
MHGPAVQSFQVPDGSWVDCIPIEQQIAAHHPALQDHIIRMHESSSTHLNLQQENADKQSLLHPQRFAREHGGCPEGSIPVQRMSTDSKQLSLRKQQEYYRRHPRHSKHMGNGSAAAANELGHLYAVVGAPETVGAYAGAGAIFSVNGPGKWVLQSGLSWVCADKQHLGTGWKLSIHHTRRGDSERIQLRRRNLHLCELQF